MNIYRVNFKINLILTTVSFLDDYKLVKKRSECKSGTEEYKGIYNLAGCANECRGTAQNFAFGTNEFGKSKCSSSGCKCFCEFGTKNYTCEEIAEHDGFNLYAFRGRYQLNSDNTMPKKAILLVTCMHLKVGIKFTHSPNPKRPSSLLPTQYRYKSPF